MKKLEFVFVPLPAIGHLVSTVEFSRVLVGRDDRFSVTILIMKGPILHSAPPESSNPNPSPSSPSVFLHDIMERQKLLVRDAIHQLMNRSGTGQLVGIVIHILCTSIMDVADELGVPSYIFFTSSAAALALMFHLQTLHDHHGLDLTEFADSEATELVVPGFVNSVPARVLPALWVDKEGSGSVKFLHEARRVRQAKGILVNSFIELESHVINSFVDGTTPPVYTVGPLLNLNHWDHQNQQDSESDVIRWLDDQPPSSVVFLCFGSVGAFNEDQVKDIARGLQNSGYRFLWSLRRPPPKGTRSVRGDGSS